jgi:hypothetical protein
MEFAARIYIHEDGERQVVPRHDCELGRAYSLHTGRDWLDAGEATQLRALLDTYRSVAEELPDRVVCALRWTSMRKDSAQVATSALTAATTSA